MSEAEHREIEVGGLRMHVAEQGADGPLVVLLHGFPESWYSWRHQLAALAAAGFRAVAPDQRGYGRTGGPDDAERYTLLDLVGDVIGLIDALGGERAIVIGHDWARRSRGTPRCCARTASRASPASASRSRRGCRSRRWTRGARRSATASTRSTSRSRASPRPSSRPTSRRRCAAC